MAIGFSSWNDDPPFRDKEYVEVEKIIYKIPESTKELLRDLRKYLRHQLDSTYNVRHKLLEKIDKELCQKKQ